MVDNLLLISIDIKISLSLNLYNHMLLSLTIFALLYSYRLYSIPIELISCNIYHFHSFINLHIYSPMQLNNSSSHYLYNSQIQMSSPCLPLSQLIIYLLYLPTYLSKKMMARTYIQALHMIEIMA